MQVRLTTANAENAVPYSSNSRLKTLHQYASLVCLVFLVLFKPATNNKPLTETLSPKETPKSRLKARNSLTTILYLPKLHA
jgi:hypothetical protein